MACEPREQSLACCCTSLLTCKSLVWSTRSMAGASFVRADLHVHTYADTEESPQPNLDAYIAAATTAGLSVLAVTDHNTARFARAAVDAAAEKGILLLPGVEISTHDGHLLALFSPNALDALEGFAN